MVETTRLVGSETAVIASGLFAYESERQFDRRSQGAQGARRGTRIRALEKKAKKEIRNLFGFLCYGGDDKARTCDLHDVNVAL